MLLFEAEAAMSVIDRDVSTEVQLGIAFAGESSPLVLECAARLCELDLLDTPTYQISDIADSEFFAALNEFRRENRLPECEFLDPVSARLLTGRELSGDALILLASCAESLPGQSELDCYDFCKHVLETSASLGITPTRYLTARYDLASLKPPSPDSVKCAMLAQLLTRPS